MTAAAILIGLTVGWWFGTGPAALITVPDLVSMNEIDARGATSQLPIKFESVDEYSDKDKGTVIRTDPPAGAYLMRDGSLKVYLSMGPKLNTVPNLLGKNLADATLTLRGANLWVGTVESFFNDAALGTVYDYSGSDGTSYPDGSKIDLKVSLGPIPMVQGVSKEVASALLTAAGLKVGKVTEAYSDTVPKGQVISIVPQSADLTKGGSVDLTVSKGSDKVIMPKVVGETIAASKLALESLGLRVIVDTNQLTSKWGVAKVKSASATAGSTLRIGDSVTIVSR
jgi:serine/threonine-protein kinase